MEDGHLDIISGNLHEFQAAISASAGAVAGSAGIAEQSEVIPPAKTLRLLREAGAAKQREN
jgi:hypothetical protein